MPKSIHDSGKDTLLFYGESADAVHSNQEIGWRYVGCAGFDDQCQDCGFWQRVKKPDIARFDLPCSSCGSKNRERHFHHLAGIRCNCEAGPQKFALTVRAREIAMGGGRGGLKSETGFAYTVRGNTHDPKGRPITAPSGFDATYINCPTYRFLVIRKNAKDLTDWWHRAKKFYSLFGKAGAPVLFNDTDKIIRFPSGAEGVADHLATDDAYEKYQGQNFQTLWVEEATQIPNFISYDRLSQSCRSAIPGIVATIFLTANPGGPGHSWFKERFSSLGDRNIYTDPVTGLTRVFIFSSVFDNPYYLQGNADYLHSLMGLTNEILRRQWLFGSFDEIEGQYFPEFRSEWREGLEPAEACHVVKAGSVELLPYWHRWIGMDWGFAHSACVYWACQHPEGRVYIYRELVLSKVGAEEIGLLIAKESLPDLVMRDGIRSLTIHLSPDAFAHKDATNTIAQQLAKGIGRVIGRDSVFLMDYTDEEKFLPEEQAWNSMLDRKARFRSEISVTITRAEDARVSGWNRIREFLRWKRIITTTEPDPAVVARLAEEKGTLAVREYVQMFADQKAEVLPRVKILDTCPQLIAKIPAAQHSPTRPEDVHKVDGDDEVDAFRYTIMAATGVQNEKPRSFFIADRVRDFIALLPGLSSHGQHMIEMKARDDYEWAHTTRGKGFNFVRRAGKGLRRSHRTPK